VLSDFNCNDLSSSLAEEEEDERRRRGRPITMMSSVNEAIKSGSMKLLRALLRLSFVLEDG